MKPLSLWFAIAATLLIGTSAHAQSTYVEGQHYTVLPTPIPASNRGKIEVMEFFWFGDARSYQFEPLVQQWQMDAENDVAFQQVPAMWNERMQVQAKAFYTAQALGTRGMTWALFESANLSGQRLQTATEIESVFTANGVTSQDFQKAFNSFAVEAQVRQASALMRQARLTGAPAILVAGKYVITGTSAGSHQNMLKVADYLIHMERNQRSGADTGR